MLVSRQSPLTALAIEWHPDLARATRAATALMLPLLLAGTGQIPLHLIFAAIAAQNMAMAEVRGSYSLRLAILSFGGMLLGIAAALGSMSSQYLWVALLFAGVMAVIAGLLRHLSSDYGPPLSVPTVFIYLMASAAAPGHAEVLSHAVSTWAGGALGIVLQMALWPFRPQHPLRRATAECWQEAANLVSIFNSDQPRSEKGQASASQQTQLRTTLDRTLVTLNAAASKRMRPLVARLERLHLLCARFATPDSGIGYSARDAWACAWVGGNVGSLSTGLPVARKHGTRGRLDDRFSAAVAFGFPGSATPATNKPPHGRRDQGESNRRPASWFEFERYLCPNRAAGAGS